MKPVRNSSLRGYGSAEVVQRAPINGLGFYGCLSVRNGIDEIRGTGRKLYTEIDTETVMQRIDLAP